MGQSRPNLLYIVSSGHSGSTLIDLVLGNYPGLVSVGEFHRLSLYARNSVDCTCGVPVGQCSFWRSVADSAGVLFGKDSNPLSTVCTHEVMLRKDQLGIARNALQLGFLLSGIAPPNWAAKFIGRKHSIAIANSWIWLQAVARVTSCHTVVESTKDVRRMKQYFLSDPEHVRVLYLIRDGRAVAASAMRRTGCSMEFAAKRWKKDQHKIALGLRGIPKTSICQMRYEDFCADPTTEMARVFAFLGYDDPPAYAVLKKTDRHNIGGNPMRFERSVSKIKADTQWREQLDFSTLSQFERISGKLNKRLGYDS